MSEEWQMPEYAYDQWKFAPEVGWYNPEDDPATATEEALLNEITRLRSLITEWVDAYRGGVDDEDDVALDRYCDAVDALRKEASR